MPIATPRNSPIEAKKSFAPFTHMYNSAKYSLDGVWVLFTRETSSKIEGFFFLTSLVFCLLAARPLQDFMVVTILYMILFAAEALNSAIETIADKLSPEISIFAKETKDLGSAAVMFLLIALLVYHIYMMQDLLSKFI